MSLIQLLIKKVLDWLLELPPDLIGRKIERALDREADRRRRQGSHKPRKRKKVARQRVKMRS